VVLTVGAEFTAVVGADEGAVPFEGGIVGARVKAGVGTTIQCPHVFLQFSFIMSPTQ